MCANPEAGRATQAWRGEGARTGQTGRRDHDTDGDGEGQDDAGATRTGRQGAQDDADGRRREEGDWTRQTGRRDDENEKDEDGSDPDDKTEEALTRDDRKDHDSERRGRKGGKAPCKDGDEIDPGDEARDRDPGKTDKGQGRRSQARPQERQRGPRRRRRDTGKREQGTEMERSPEKKDQAGEQECAAAPSMKEGRRPRDTDRSGRSVQREKKIKEEREEREKEGRSRSKRRAKHAAKERERRTGDLPIEAGAHGKRPEKGGSDGKEDRQRAHEKRQSGQTDAEIRKRTEEERQRDGRKPWAHHQQQRRRTTPDATTKTDDEKARNQPRHSTKHYKTRATDKTRHFAQKQDTTGRGETQTHWTRTAQKIHDSTTETRSPDEYEHHKPTSQTRTPSNARVEVHQRTQVLTQPPGPQEHQDHDARQHEEDQTSETTNPLAMCSTGRCDIYPQYETECAKSRGRPQRHQERQEERSAITNTGFSCSAITAEPVRICSPRSLHSDSEYDFSVVKPILQGQYGGHDGADQGRNNRKSEEATRGETKSPTAGATTDGGRPVGRYQVGRPPCATCAERGVPRLQFPLAVARCMTMWFARAWFACAAKSVDATRTWRAGSV